MIKLFKTFLLFITITFFTSVSINAIAAEDCSQYKKLSHKYNKCKLGKLKDIGKGNDSASVDADKPENPVVGGIKGIFKKIKDFGGKKVGEPE